MRDARHRKRKKSRRRSRANIGDHHRKNVGKIGASIEALGSVSGIQ